MIRNIAFAFLAWGVFANLPFFVLSYSYSFERAGYLFIYLLLFVVVSLLARSDMPARRKAWATAIVYGMFLGLTFFGLIVFCSLLFGLRVVEILVSLPLLLRIDVFANPQYVAFGLFVVGSLAAFFYFSRRANVRRPAEIAAVGCLLLGLVALDTLSNGNMYYRTRGVDGVVQSALATTVPFDRAVHAGGVYPARLTAEDDRDLLLVVVEALGAFRDPGLNRALLEPFDDPALAERFEVVQGVVPFLGSTTAAEMRELCGSTESYLEIVDGDFDTSTCLPRFLAGRGYRTLAYHGYLSDFFDRADWYPKLGFSRSLFSDGLAREMGKGNFELCGGTFEGLCDRQIGDLILGDLKRAPGKTFAYWVTLNSHFPARRTKGFGTSFACSENGLDREGQACVMAEYWTEVFDTVIRIAEAERPRPIDIVVVGDHAPPLLARGERDRFIPNRVPFVVLKAKPDA